MMNIIEHHHFSRESSSTSLADTELEDSPMSPWESSGPMLVPVNNYGRPTAAILRTPMNDNHGTTTINRPLTTYTTNFAANNPNFQTQQPDNIGHQQASRLSNDIHTSRVNLNSAFTANPINLPMYSNAPLMIQIPPNEGNSHIPQLNGGPNPLPTPHFPFQVGHRTNLQPLPLQKRQIYRLLCLQCPQSCPISPVCAIGAENVMT